MTWRRKSRYIKIVAGVYQIRNLINNMVYIGSTADIGSRFDYHKSALRQGTSHHTKLQKAWNEFGSDKFVFEVVEVIGNKRTRVKREQYYMNTLDVVRLGYNMRYKAVIKKSYVMPNATRGQISVTLRERKCNVGIPHTPEHNLKISIAHQGKKFTPEHRSNMRISRLAYIKKQQRGDL